MITENTDDLRDITALLIAHAGRVKVTPGSVFLEDGLVTYRVGPDLRSRSAVHPDAILGVDRNRADLLSYLSAEWERMRREHPQPEGAATLMFTAWVGSEHAALFAAETFPRTSASYAAIHDVIREQEQARTREALLDALEGLEPAAQVNAAADLLAHLQATS